MLRQFRAAKIAGAHGRVRPGTSTFCAALAILLFANGLHAQPLQTPSEPTVTSPRLKSDAGVAYPEAALRARISQSVKVDLVLVLDTQGRVSDAQVVEARGHGFDQAALEAAKKLVFEPALRDGRAITARIRFRYTFSPPSAKLVGQVRTLTTDSPIAGALVSVRGPAFGDRSALTAADGRWSLPDLPAGAIHVRVTSSGRQPTEVDAVLDAGGETDIVLRLAANSTTAAHEQGETVITVKGDRLPREVSKRTLNRDEIRHSAGTQGDALLSIQNLPGIARPPPFSGQLVVRGSAPDDTIVLVDGTEVPLAYHFGGLSSVIPTELLEQIDFYPGNFSARYGRAMGGIVEARLRPPRVSGYHLVIENSVLGARGIVEGPLGKGFSFFAAGQRSWLDLLITPILKAEGETQTALPSWADYQLAVRKDFNLDSSLSVLFFGSDDSYDIIDPVSNAADPGSAGALGYHTAFWRAQANFESQLTSRTHFKLTAAYGQDRLALSLGNNLIDATLHPLTSRAELSHQVMAGLRANVGFDLSYQAYDFALQLPPATRPGVPSGGPGQPPIRSQGSKSLFQPGAYAELEIVPWTGTRIVPGLRADYDNAIGHWDVAPLLNVRQDLTGSYPKITLKGGAGLYYQPPSPFDTAPGLGQTGLTSNRSTHYDVGLEQEFSRHLELSTDVFYKRFDRLVMPVARNAGSGSAYGVEWLLRYKADPKFFGWVAYTLSRSERRDVPSEPSSRFQFDQTQVLTVVANYKLGRGWQLGGRFRLTSGDLYTPTSPGAYNASAGSQLGVAAFPAFGARLPAFNQLDLRIEKTRNFKVLRVTWFLDVQNVYAKNNPLGVSYNYNYTQSVYTRGLPILPIFGVRLEVP